MKSLELALGVAPTLLLLAFVTVSASPQELEDYVDKEAISEAAEDFKDDLTELSEDASKKADETITLVNQTINEYQDIFDDYSETASTTFEETKKWFEDNFPLIVLAVVGVMALCVFYCLCCLCCPMSCCMCKGCFGCLGDLCPCGAVCCGCTPLGHYHV